MSKTLQLNWLRELLWWVFTAIVVGVVLFPMYGYIKPEFLGTNILFIVVTVTYGRFVIFYRQVPYLSNRWASVILFVFNVLVFWQFMRLIQDFLYVIDNYSMSAFLTDEVMFQSNDAINNAYLYFKKEFILFSTASELLIIILAVRILYVLWGDDKKW